jgi:nicotinamidase-related amidase
MNFIQEKSALLVMDVQPGIISRVSDPEGLKQATQRAIDAAHHKGIQVIYVVVGFRAGFPEVHPRNKSFQAIKDNMPAGFLDAKPVFDVKEGDLVMHKKRISAFAGNDLEMILGALGITHLVLTGIATSGVVLSTVRAAADKDYQLTVLQDLCADMDPEVHRVLLEKVFPRQAAVITSEQWIAGF